MARITQYPEETSPSANDVVLIDGVNGSRKVKVPILSGGNVIAPVELSSTSSRAYAKGDQFIFNGLLTRAKTDIAIGNTIIVGDSGNAELADCVVKSIDKAVKDLYNMTYIDSAFSYKSKIVTMPAAGMTNYAYEVKYDGLLYLLIHSVATGAIGKFSLLPSTDPSCLPICQVDDSKGIKSAQVMIPVKKGTIIYYNSSGGATKVEYRNWFNDNYI